MALTPELSEYLANRLFPYAIREGLSIDATAASMRASGFSLSNTLFRSIWADWVGRVGARDLLKDNPVDQAIRHTYHELASRAQVFNYVYVYKWETFDPLQQTWVERTASVQSPLRLSADQGLASLMRSLQDIGHSYTMDYWQGAQNVSLLRASRAQGLRNQASDKRAIQEILSGTGLTARSL